MSKLFKDKIIKDDVIVRFSSADEMKEFLDNLEKDTEVIMVDLNHTRLIHEENGSGELAQFIPTLYNMKDVSLEAVSTTLSSEGSQKMLEVSSLKTDSELEEYKEKHGDYPEDLYNHRHILMSELAYEKIAEIAQADAKGLFKFLPGKEAVDTINIYLKYVPDKLGNLIIRGDKCRSVRSEGFAELPPNELFDSLIEAIDANFQGGDFIGGSFSHEYTRAEWTLSKKTEIVKEYQEKLKEVERYTDQVNPGIRFITSDLGIAAASVSIIITSGNLSVSLGNVLRMSHRGKAKPSDFTDGLNVVIDALTSNINELTRLLGISLQSPIEVAKEIRPSKMRRVGKGVLNKAIEDYKLEYGDGPGTAHDVFYIYQKALHKMKAAGSSSQETLETVEADILKLLKPSFKWDKLAKLGKDKDDSKEDDKSSED